MSLDCGRRPDCPERTHADTHANSAHPGSNQQPSYCEATVLTTTPPCRLNDYMTYSKGLPRRTRSRGVIWKAKFRLVAFRVDSISEKIPESNLALHHSRTHVSPYLFEVMCRTSQQSHVSTFQH